MEPHAKFDIDLVEAYAAKAPIPARVVCVMDLSMTGRNLELIETPSRGLRRHEVHQLTLTDDPVLPPTTDVFPAGMAPPEGDAPSVARNASVVCFFAVEESGLVLTGDELVWDGTVVGDVRGYDTTHFPNHYNVILHADDRRTGADLGLSVGDEIVFRPRSG